MNEQDGETIRFKTWKELKNFITEEGYYVHKLAPGFTPDGNNNWWSISKSTQNILVQTENDPEMVMFYIRIFAEKEAMDESKCRKNSFESDDEYYRYRVNHYIWRYLYKVIENARKYYLTKNNN